MHIGLIGGIGPAATEFYYRALVKAHAAAGRRLDLTIANADLAEAVDNMEAGRADAQAAIFAGYIDQLNAAGARAVAVTSMGQHFCISELQAVASLPVISAIPALDGYFAREGVRRVGVLGTLAVMQSGLYGVTSAEVIAPPPQDRPTVHASYIAMAKAGFATPEQRRYFDAEARKLHRVMGVDLVLLAGTDLFLAFGESDHDYPLADSALIHVEAITALSLAP